MSQSVPPASGSALGSELVPGDLPGLVLRLPSQVADEAVGPIQDEVRARLPRVAGAVLVIDFERVTLINSIGITCLLQVQDECRRRGARLLLANLPEAISKFLKQLKLDRRFELASNVDAALARAAEPR